MLLHQSLIKPILIPIRHYKNLSRLLNVNKINLQHKKVPFQTLIQENFKIVLI